MTAVDELTPVFLIWSRTYHQWWRPKGAGYTPDFWSAGRYTETDAIRRSSGCSGPNAKDVLVPAPESGLPAPAKFTVAEIVEMGAEMARRIGVAEWQVGALCECGRVQDQCPNTGDCMNSRCLCWDCRPPCHCPDSFRDAGVHVEYCPQIGGVGMPGTEHESGRPGSAAKAFLAGVAA